MAAAARAAAAIPTAVPLASALPLMAHNRMFSQRFMESSELACHGDAARTEVNLDDSQSGNNPNAWGNYKGVNCLFVTELGERLASSVRLVAWS